MKPIRPYWNRSEGLPDGTLQKLTAQAPLEVVGSFHYLSGPHWRKSVSEHWLSTSSSVQHPALYWVEEKQAALAKKRLFTCTILWESSKDSPEPNSVESGCSSPTFQGKPTEKPPRTPASLDAACSPYPWGPASIGVLPGAPVHLILLSRVSDLFPIFVLLWFGLVLLLIWNVLLKTHTSSPSWGLMLREHISKKDFQALSFHILSPPHINECRAHLNEKKAKRGKWLISQKSLPSTGLWEYTRLGPSVVSGKNSMSGFKKVYYKSSKLYCKELKNIDKSK